MKNKIIYWENEFIKETSVNSIVDTDIYEIVGKLNMDNSADASPTTFNLQELKERENEWDYIIYAHPDVNIEENLSQLFSAMDISMDRVFNLFLITTMKWSKSAIMSKILRPDGSLHLRSLYHNMSCHSKYNAITAQGMTFISSALDLVIPLYMFESKKVWSYNEMTRLSELLDKYYSINNLSNGVFFDIGANIGTTSVYMKKEILPNFKLCAFEPIKENFKLLSANLILNNITNYDVQNLALSSKKSEYNMKHVIGNWGMCKITDDEGDNLERVESITLDEYISYSNLDTSEPMVLWIDTEGFEIDVLLGAKETLKNKPALYFEFNRKAYGDRIDSLIELLSSNYSGFINFGSGEDIIETDFEKLRVHDPDNQVDLLMIP